MSDIAVVGLGFGDEGKGTIVDFLCHQYHIKNVVRYNGGPQAAHNVVNNKGQWHCFAQFGSHSMQEGSYTYLSQYMYVDLLAMNQEYKVLANKGFERVIFRTFIHPQCLLVTPLHQLVNQIREKSRSQRHGSCGMGVGEVFADKQETRLILRVGELVNFSDFAEKMHLLYQQKLQQAKAMADDQMEELRVLQNVSMPDLLTDYHAIKERMQKNFLPLVKTSMDRQSKVYEGAQGTLLDKDYGFFPYITPSTTTIDHAIQISKNHDSTIHRSIGIIRCYATRHGNGPFVTESRQLNQSLMDAKNPQTSWQGRMRFGWLDLLALRYSLACNQTISELAITCLDQIRNFSHIKICCEYILEERFFVETLQKYFVYHKEKKHYRMIQIIKNDFLTLDEREIFTDLLGKMQPVYRKFPCWNNIMVNGRLDVNLRNWLNFLESKPGLSLPVTILSTGNKTDDKMDVHSDFASRFAVEK